MKSISYQYSLGYEHALIALKRGIWLYFYFLIFEGALRKWILPGFSEPLLIIRDPLAIWIIFKALQYGFWKPNGYVILTWLVSIFALVLTFYIGHGNIPVAVYGLRITVIHFPVIFIIGSVFNKEDVIKVGQVLLWLNIAMTFLVALQFFSPQSSWINKSIGGDLDGSGFSGAAGYFRVPGTFSFTNGLSLFYGLAAAFIFYFWLVERYLKVSRFLLIASTLALIIAIPLSISRTILFQVAVIFAFMLAISGKNPQVIKKIGMVLITVIILLTFVKDFSFFQTASMVFNERFTSANEVEGGMEGVVIDRFLGGMYGAITEEEYPFWGMGLGMGSNVGSKLLTGEAGVYLVSEGEWGRLIGEMGIVLGLMMILIRCSLVVDLMRKSWGVINEGNILPWMLIGFGVFHIIQGQWSQPTSLGFSVLIGGLIIASLNEE